MTATQYLAKAWVENGRVRVVLTPDAPDGTVEALRKVKPAILILHQAAEQARCAEPQHVLVHEFRFDLEQMAAGAWPVETVAEAIRMIGPGYQWTFNREHAA